MAYTEESNNGLYFIVGGLVVVAFLFGFMMWNPEAVNGPANISPAAGYSEPATPTETRTDRTRVEFQNNATGDKSVTETTKSTTQQGQ